MDAGAVLREDARERATIERAAADVRLDEHDARAAVGAADDLVVREAVEHLVRDDEAVASEAEPRTAAREVGARPADGRRERPELRPLARDERGAPLDHAVAERAGERAPGRVVGARGDRRDDVAAELPVAGADLADLERARPARGDPRAPRRGGDHLAEER